MEIADCPPRIMRGLFPLVSIEARPRSATSRPAQVVISLGAKKPTATPLAVSSIAAFDSVQVY
jgi:hypothetical protein